MQSFVKFTALENNIACSHLADNAFVVHFEFLELKSVEKLSIIMSYH
jgi:hypothetical protein